jgi:2-polyprenyl-3-methyl-5-hydroxy-6-metoxy-1,4-benzoquinol methylase
MINKIRFFTTCVAHLTSSGRLLCPSCGTGAAEIISRKYGVTALRRCAQCALLFRTPTTNSAENASFYQESYSQGFTSDVPTELELKRLIACKFVGSVRDYTPYIKALTSLGIKSGDRILDFGCSWGYGSWQLREHGFNVTSVEISKLRCLYAREKLNLEAYDSMEQIPSVSYDVFFSSHVMEHVPCVSSVFEYARAKLKKGGLFLAFTPNGSSQFRRLQPKAWQQLWGMVHPNFLDDIFYKKTFPNVLLASDPYDFCEIEKNWNSSGDKSAPQLKGVELMAAVKME